MAQSTWTTDDLVLEQPKSSRLKFIIAGGILAVLIGFLITRTLGQEGQFFITIDEYYGQTDKYVDRDVRVSAYVIGDSINFEQIDATTTRLEFDIADSANGPTQLIHIVAYNEALPDLLQHEAQAIIEGRFDTAGNLVANSDGILLKCPTRYEEAEAAY